MSSRITSRATPAPHALAQAPIHASLQASVLAAGLLGAALLLAFAGCSGPEAPPDPNHTAAAAGSGGESDEAYTASPLAPGADGGSLDGDGTTPEAPGQVLIFSRTAGYRHASIADGLAALSELAAELGLEARHSEDPRALDDLADRANVRVVVFLSTTGDVLDLSQEAAFKRRVQAGGGYVGVHSASDTEYDWPWYGQLAGARFASHPAIQPAHVLRVGAHPSVDFLPEPWERTDEWYDFRDVSPGITPLLALDEATYTGHAAMESQPGGQHPIAWYHEFDGGRAWYTGGGHTKASFAEPLFRRHLLEGLRYAAGLPAAD